MYTEQQIKELKKEVRKWINGQDLTNKKVFSLPIKQFIFFTKQGYKHTLGRTYKKFPEVELILTPHLFEIITDAIHVEFKKDYKKRPEIKGIHNYIAIVSMDIGVYLIWIKIREGIKESIFYDHGVIAKLK